MVNITLPQNLKHTVAALSLMTFCYAAFQGICQSIVPLSMANQAYTKTMIGLVSSRFLSRSVPIEPQVSAREFITGAYVQLYRLVTREPIVLLGMSFVALNCFLLYVMGGSFYLLYASQIGLSAFVAASLVSGRDAISAVLRFGFDTITRYASPIILLGVGTVLGALSLALLPITDSLFGVTIIAVAQGLFLALLPPAVNTMVGSATEPKHHSYAIVGMHSSNFIAQTTMSPVLGLLLSGFGYNIVYPIIGGIWIILALLVFRTGIRMMHDGEKRKPAVILSTAD